MKRIYEVEKITDLKDMINKTCEKHAELPAYKFKTEQEGIFEEVTYKELKENIECLGTALIDMGLKDKRIAIISENRYEWAVAYLAVACGVGVVVPLDKALPANEIESLIIRSGVETIFYSNKYNEIMEDIKSRHTTDLRYYISMDLNERVEGTYSQKELYQKGKELIEKEDRRFIDAKINADEMEFMLFTSGTTSKSKAVMLSHRNICTNIMDIGSVIKVTPEDTILSFLPLHHTFECTVGFLYILSRGATIVFCDGIRHIASNIKEYGVTIMISVPALYENMYKQVIRGIEKKGMMPTVQKGKKISGLLLKVGLDLRNKMFREIHETLGSQLRLLVNGGAALNPEVEKGFNELGFKTVQGYGLTETSPVIAAGNDKYSRTGSVGKLFPSLKMKIVDKNKEGVGEIIVKGPSVMLGYYQNEEATKSVLKDGWFYTGDLGYIDKDDYIFITGRKKDVIVLKNGKNIYPEELENKVNKIDGVIESYVYGKLGEKDDDVKICVKIVYDEKIVEEIYGIKDKNEILEQYWKKIKEINKTMPAYKYIREVMVTEEELIKTTTLKIKRFEELKKTLGQQ